MSHLSFTEHPASVGETYSQHLRMAWSFALPLFGAAIACAIHGIFPFLFTTTASGTVRRLHERMVLHRTAASAAQPLRRAV